MVVDMSTIVSAVSRRDEIECDRDLDTVLCGLEDNSSLLLPAQLRERLLVLDDLDARAGGCGAENSTTYAGSRRIHQRVNTLRARLEAANAELYQAVRADIVLGGQSRALLHYLRKSAGRDESNGPLPGLGFDCGDELMSGVLQLREPNEPDLQRSPEMVPYQPTPVRHILHLIAATKLAADDVFVDLGSGLGHVPLLVSMLTGAQCLGIEVQAAYVASSRECAQSLQLSRVRFIAQDARDADLSSGSVFYLYSPFNGSILSDVLNRLRMESAHRSIRVCSLGPCTRTVANETWLKASVLPDTRRVTIFDSL
jgi:Histone methylation protein DOT1